MRRRPFVASLFAAALVLASCGGGDQQPDTVSWRNVTLDLPEDWYLVEEEDDRLSISNAALAMGSEEDDDPEPPEGDVVAMFFTYEPGTLPDDWRRFVEQQDATLESDVQFELDGEVPATRLVFSYESGGVPTREMVVVIPSRAIVLLALPVPGPGDDDAPEIFLDHVDTFMEVLDDATFGAPVLDE